MPNLPSLSCDSLAAAVHARRPSSFLRLARLRSGRLAALVMLLPVADRGLDRVFGQHRAVNLDGRQIQLLHDDRIPDRHRLVDMLAFDQFGYVAGTGDRAAASEGLEARVFDYPAFRIDAKLQLHHVAAFRRAHDSGADVGVVLVETADIARIVVMIDNFIRISHNLYL